ncbi:MAG: HEAT repeat domain-containing protein [Elusimicrobia bacterium]|nr:HEAT repeat domain-containing protein [Elusimicrobiota bacterium]
MNYVMLLLAAIVASYMAWQRFKPLPPPPPPPPPPAILSEPAPVINEAEQAKILKSTEDQDPSVRWEAVLLLDKFRSPHAMPTMFHMVQKDLDPQLRVKVVELLGHRNSPEVMQALIGALKDQEVDVRLAAIRSIERIGDYTAASVLTTGPIKDQEESVRLQALKTINVLQDKRQAEIEAARQQYEEEKKRVAAEAAKK